jgi:hypothetical protein
MERLTDIDGDPGWPDESFREYATHSADHDQLSTRRRHTDAYRQYTERRLAEIHAADAAAGTRQ